MLGAGLVLDVHSVVAAGLVLRVGGDSGPRVHLLGEGLAGTGAAASFRHRDWSASVGVVDGDESMLMTRRATRPAKHTLLPCICATLTGCRLAYFHKHC
ncbi:hypothetical protein DFJ74DRAFT_683089 [Hyaloraphidium curvatum]|nr:hypothetical protein DFJ74DRAFT_683089 [Hyaloraphidium curvatum]